MLVWRQQRLRSGRHSGHPVTEPPELIGDELQDLLVKEQKSDADVLRALEIMRSGDAVAYAMQLAKDYAEAAKQQLEIFPDVPAREMLCDIADYVLSREK